MLELRSLAKAVRCLEQASCSIIKRCKFYKHLPDGFESIAQYLLSRCSTSLYFISNAVTYTPFLMALAMIYTLEVWWIAELKGEANNTGKGVDGTRSIHHLSLRSFH
jgi:hypothetical protein